MTDLFPQDETVPTVSDLKLPAGQDNLILPLHSEAVTIVRRQVARSTVRVATETRLVSRLVEENLVREQVEIERIVIGRIVDNVPSAREEGDLTILPVVEEVVVTRRRYFLKEEVRIRRVRTTEHYKETVHLREQEAVVTRNPVPDQHVFNPDPKDPVL